VVEDTAEVRYLVLPAVSAGELTDVEIEAVAAGMLLPGWCRATPNPTISMGHGGAIS